MSKFNPQEHLIQLKGKPYLPVAARLVWLNEDNVSFDISTERLEHTPDLAMFRATVKLLDESGRTIKCATGTKLVTKTSFPNFTEKSETGAIGRALGMLGYGTQFEPEFDELEGESERVVDAPQTFTVTQKIVNLAVSLFPVCGDELLARIDKAAAKILSVEVENFELLEAKQLTLVLQAFQEQVKSRHQKAGRK